MNTGFNELDKLVDLNKPQLILITGTENIEELSGDISNNVCLNQEKEVLEIVKSKKEYLIKRLMTNYCNVNYNKWTIKNQYSDEELKKIGQSTVNLIETTKRLPTIIEQDMQLYDFDNVLNLILQYGNIYGDREETNCLVVLDLFNLSNKHMKINKEKTKSINFLKQVEATKKKLNLPIIVVYDIEIQQKNEYITKEHILDVEELEKYIDTFIILNRLNSNFIIDVYDKNTKIGNCKLKYNLDLRKFE